MSYEETLDYLFQQLPMYQRQGKPAYKKDLSNTLKLCQKLNNPQQEFKSIHIAGTNGKGSVAHMLASIFQTAGYKTGLYTSPHLKDFRERIRVNGKMIAKDEIMAFVKNWQNQFQEIHPSFFEWTVALAFHYFDKHQVDIGIIETGLGGRLDSTNVIKPELSVITNIGFDHMDFLGETLAEIAGEKAGIIKANIPCLIGNACGQELIFEQKAKGVAAEVHYASDSALQLELDSDLRGNYQKENLQTVYSSWLQLRKQGWAISFPHLQKGLMNVAKNTGLQGRWQVLKLNPKVIADTAHNKEGITYTTKQLQEEAFQTLHIVLGVVKEKRLDDILSLFPKYANYYFCQAEIPRAMDANQLAKEASNFNLSGKVYSSVQLAYQAALQEAKQEDLIYIGGSTFVVAEVL